MPRYIDADALIEVYKQYLALLKEEGTTYVDISWEEEIMSDIETISKAPTVDAESVRHGHWINHFDDLYPEDSSVECSVCHEYEGIMANDNYCPNCGAKMDESI